MDRNSGTVAGRGEGLAGLVAQWEEIAEHGTGTPMTDSFQFRCAMERCAAELKLALEAAAPPSTARERLAQAICEFHQHSRWSKDGETIHYAEADWILAMPEFALATPSPQAPAQDENVILSLRKRIHFIERHNQYFDRCESAWCHPSQENDPAKEGFGDYIDACAIAEILRVKYPTYGAGFTLNLPATIDVVSAVLKELRAKGANDEQPRP